MTTQFRETLTLTKLAEELTAQRLRKRDLVVPSSSLTMREGKILVAGGGEQIPGLDELLKAAGVSGSKTEDNALAVEPNLVCHEHVSEKLQIPWKYYKRMLETGIPLLDWNVDFWLRKMDNTNFLLRTFMPTSGSGPNIGRALLSDRFGVFDHLDMLITALDAIKETGVRVEVQSAQLSDRRMYVSLAAPDIVTAARDLVKSYRPPAKSHGWVNFEKQGIAAGIILTNSETGCGRYVIAPRIIQTACNNGAIMMSDAIARTHIGKRMEEGVIEWSQDTRRKEVELIKAQTKDAVQTFLTGDYLERIVDALSVDGTKKLDKPADCVKNVCLELGLGEEKSQSVLDYFIQGGNTTRFGVVQALTFYAQTDQSSPDEQYDIERGALELVPVMDKFDKEAKKR
jgi:hypothetical protein